jgi:hypothetical protein
MCEFERGRLGGTRKGGFVQTASSHAMAHRLSWADNDDREMIPEMMTIMMAHGPGLISIGKKGGRKAVLLECEVPSSKS